MGQEHFTVIVVDGEACEIGDYDTQSVRYDGLTWDESVQLAQLSFGQGFEVIVWKIDENK